MLQPSHPYQKAWAANANTSSFASKIPTTTEPTNDGVVDLVNRMGGGMVPERVLVLPYGLGSNNDAASMRVIGWRHIGSGISPGVLWVPTILIEVACTFSAAVGIAGAPVLNTECFADTITVVTQRLISGTISAAAASLGMSEIFSPTNDLVAQLIIPVLGFEKLEFTFDQTTNTPTCNALIAFL